MILLIYLFNIIGSIFRLNGIIIWSKAALGEKGITKYIAQEKLRTDGVYTIVKHPLYTGHAIALTGIALFFHNFFSLLLPFIYFVFLTILMKNTEEKWLLDKFGKEYEDYCKNVNLCIPNINLKKIFCYRIK